MYTWTLWYCTAAYLSKVSSWSLSDIVARRRSLRFAAMRSRRRVSDRRWVSLRLLRLRVE